MKKHTYFLAILFALAFSTASPGVMAKNGNNGNNRADKVGVCHATSSESNPYVFITVSNRALETHLTHHGEDDFEGTSLQYCLDNEPPPDLPTNEIDCLMYALVTGLPYAWDPVDGCVLRE